MDIQERAKKIRLLLLDVDGILTNGKIAYGNYGDELKNFDIYDGFGLALLSKTPIKVALLTAKKSKIIVKRAKDLNIRYVYQNATNKLDIYQNILKKVFIADEEICFMGDELIDIPVLKRVGLAVTVPKAPEEVRQCVHYITKKDGGEGAVREVVEVILRSQGLWDALVKMYNE